jgi:hypothetical protein
LKRKKSVNVVSFRLHLFVGEGVDCRGLSNTVQQAVGALTPKKKKKKKNQAPPVARDEARLK